VRSRPTIGRASGCRSARCRATRMARKPSRAKRRKVIGAGARVAGATILAGPPWRPAHVRPRDARRLVSGLIRIPLRWTRADLAALAGRRPRCRRRAAGPGAQRARRAQKSRRCSSAHPEWLPRARFLGRSSRRSRDFRDQPAAARKLQHGDAGAVRGRGRPAPPPGKGGPFRLSCVPGHGEPNCRSM
jgi:hypothetical protein